MCTDFKESIIQLMQHPIMCNPHSLLSVDEQQSAYELLNTLNHLSFDEGYARTDMQITRLEYNLGELSCQLGAGTDEVVAHYRSALHNVDKGAIKLGLDKWVELANLRTAKA